MSKHQNVEKAMEKYFESLVQSRKKDRKFMSAITAFTNPEKKTRRNKFSYLFTENLKIRWKRTILYKFLNLMKKVEKLMVTTVTRQKSEASEPVCLFT